MTNSPLVERAVKPDDARMQSADQHALLVRELVVARRRLEGDTPHSPAWATVIEWVDDLERTIRELDLRRGHQRIA